MRIRIFAVADLHFGHESIVKHFGRNHLFNTIEDHDEFLIKRWNSVVKDLDLVYVLGDFVWNKCSRKYFAEIMSRLNGDKILIIGNHDRITEFQAIKLGFKSAFYSARIKRKKTIINLSHFPYKLPFWKLIWLKFRGIKVKQFKEALNDDGNWLIHGHTHRTELINPFHKKSICVSCDALDFRPILIDTVVNKIKEIEIDILPIAKARGITVGYDKTCKN